MTPDRSKFGGFNIPTSDAQRSDGSDQGTLNRTVSRLSEATGSRRTPPAQPLWTHEGGVPSDTVTRTKPD